MIDTAASLRRASEMVRAATPTAADWLAFAARIRAATPTLEETARALRAAGRAMRKEGPSTEAPDPS